MTMKFSTAILFLFSISLLPQTATAITCYADSDQDGYGSNFVLYDDPQLAVCPGGDYSNNNLDCDDADASVHPGATEVPYDGVDQNCNGFSDDSDMDQDGYEATIVGGTDCDDANADVNPGMYEVPFNGIDDDCDMIIDDGMNDSDLDGLSDIYEYGDDVMPTFSDPWDYDSDDDGLGDGLESSLMTDPLDADTDDDGVLDGEEHFIYLTDPKDPDSDADGLSDGLELGMSTPILGGESEVMRLPYYGTGGGWVPDADPFSTTNPLSQDTDNGGIWDGDEDINQNGLVDVGEIDPNSTPDDYFWIDQDADGVPDIIDNCQFIANPDQLDSDGNGIGDVCESDVGELEADVEELKALVNALQQQLNELKGSYPTHNHTYMTGNGAGHNNTLEETGGVIQE